MQYFNNKQCYSFLFFNYTEAQSCLCLPIVMNLLNEGKAVVQCKNDSFVKAVMKYKN